VAACVELSSAGRSAAAFEMARRRSRRKKRSRARIASLGRLRFSLAELEQSQLDAIGLALVGAAVFTSLLFYFGWEGGEVGGGLADFLRFLLGKVAYLVPLVLLGAGSGLMLRSALPEHIRLRAGATLLLLGVALGFAAGSLGLGPDHPARHGYFHASYFNDHGGLVGEALYFAASTLFQRAGAHIVFFLMVLGGGLLLTGASITGLVRLVADAVRGASARGRDLGRAFADERERARSDALEAEIEAYEEAGEPLVDEIDDEEEDTLTDLDPLEAVGDEIQSRARSDEEPPAGVPLEAAGDEDEIGERTPMGERRGAVTESEEIRYRLPEPDFLRRSAPGNAPDRSNQQEVADLLVETLGHFGIDADVVGRVSGPRVTRYELSLAPGTKVSKVTQLKDDLAYALASTDIRILAPIPGKQAVGVEVPNPSHRMVFLGDIFKRKIPNGANTRAARRQAEERAQAGLGASPLVVWLGKDIAGKAVWTDLARMPHVLVAGTTGAGKSGCINAMLSSILLRATPNEVRMVLVDPKRVELNYYEDVPHLLTPVVTVPRMAANVLNNLIAEMESRYEVMGEARARNIVELNRARAAAKEPPLPYILCVIDELADLMIVAPAEVEDAIIRLAQKSRAVGIHLLLATQRPSVDVITGTIKVNVPARISFAVSSQHDSRVILDQGGAEALLGQGDMLFRPVGSSKLQRIQGAYITEEEIARLTDEWRRQGEPSYDEELLEGREAEEEDEREFSPDEDDLLTEAIELVAQTQTASVSMLQRRLRVGYTRAGRLIDMLERRGVISGYEGSKPRQVLISEADVARVLSGAGSERSHGVAATAAIDADDELDGD
jgi:S-DNA-T family DNA segregation ATPase FtsK/SpoIIIE